MSRTVAPLLAALLGGCMAPPPGPAPAGTAFDGRYVGQVVLVQGDTRPDINDFPCGPLSYTATLAVRDGWFDYPYAVDPLPHGPLPVMIAADGTFDMINYFPVPPFDPAWVAVRGKVADGTLDATIRNYRCTQRLTAQRS